MNLRSVVIVSAVRTPVGKIGGSIKDVAPETLSKIVLAAAVDRSGIALDLVESVILGQTKQSADASNIARKAALMAGLSETTPAYTIHKQCGSGMQAVLNGVMEIQNGYADIVLAGGVESMSMAQFYLRNARYGYNAGNGLLLDPNIESQPGSQPIDKYGSFTMGYTAEILAEKYQISREEQDEFALISQQKAIAAIDNGSFATEIIAVPYQQDKKTHQFIVDECPRRAIDLGKMTKLQPIFKEGGSVTAGNSSGRNDGAAALLLMSEDKARELNIKPLGRFVAAGTSGVDPRLMGIGPVPAIHKALARANLTLEDIDLIELNEAFAAQILAIDREMHINRDILNVNGGAIAIGHPLGMTGARLIVTLLYAMKKRGDRYGLASLCIAGGQGLAIIIQQAV